MSYLKLRIAFLIAAIGGLLPATAGAQATTGFLLIDNGAYPDSDADWVLDGAINCQTCCPSGKKTFSYGTACNCKSYGGAQAGGSGSVTGFANCKSFTLTFSFTGQVSPGLLPAGAATQPCLNVEAIHQLRTSSTFCEEGKLNGCLNLLESDVNTHTKSENGSIQFAMVTLDSCVTPVGTQKTISWSYTITGSASGIAGAVGRWVVNDGGPADIQLDGGQFSGSYINTSGCDVQVSGDGDIDDGIMFAAYGSVQATVSSEDNPQPAVSFDFDSTVNLDLQVVGDANDANLTWNFSASIQDP